MQGGREGGLTQGEERDGDAAWSRQLLCEIGVDRFLGERSFPLPFSRTCRENTRRRRKNVHVICDTALKYDWACVTVLYH